MKKIIATTLFTLLVVAGCPQAEVEEAANTLTFKGEGYTFEYPDTWTVKDDQFLYSSEDPENSKISAQAVRLDFMGPRCSVFLEEKKYKDAKGRTWEYSISKPGLPEDMVELCKESGYGEESNQRTANLSFSDDNNYYLASFFYSYELEDEEESLDHLYRILDSTEIETNTEEYLDDETGISFLVPEDWIVSSDENGNLYTYGQDPYRTVTFEMFDSEEAYNERVKVLQDYSEENDTLSREYNLKNAEGFQFTFGGDAVHFLQTFDSKYFEVSFSSLGEDKDIGMIFSNLKFN